MGEPSVSARSCSESSSLTWVTSGEHSVVPNTMLKRMPRSRSTRRTSSAGTGDPPETATRNEDRSRRSKSGWSSMAIIMVGTPANDCGPLGLEQFEH